MGPFGTATILSKKMKRNLKHRSRSLKIKLILTVILPGIIILLGTKTAQLWLKINLRAASAKISSENAERSEIEPVDQEVIGNDWVTPEPVPYKPV